MKRSKRLIRKEFNKDSEYNIIIGIVRKMSSTQENLEKVYQIVNITLLACMIMVTSFFIAYKLRFRLEKPAIVIICTQLIVMGVRVFQS